MILPFMLFAPRRGLGAHLSTMRGRGEVPLGQAHNRGLFLAKYLI
jgi:hypothetical protein